MFLENTEKYEMFFVPIEKEITKIDMAMIIIKFIDSTRFMATSLSNLVDNAAEGIHKIKCKDYNCFLEYESVKDNLIKCLSCNENYSDRIDKEFQEIQRDSRDSKEIQRDSRTHLMKYSLKKKNFIAT